MRRSKYPGLLTVAEASARLGYSHYSYEEAEVLIKQGELAVTKIDRLRYVREDDVMAHLLRLQGVRSVEEALTEVERLRAEVTQLHADIEARDARKVDYAREALELLSLDECLEILGRIESAEDVWSKQWRAAGEAKQRVIAQMDQRDAPASIGARPSRVPERAQSKTLATAIGLVDIWYWTRPNGYYDSSVGGPRPERVWNGRGGGKREAVKVARAAALRIYGKPTRQSSARLRFLILERDHFTCRYCGRKAPDVELHVDHAISIAEGGADELENLVTACRDCNLGKAGRSVPL